MELTANGRHRDRLDRILAMAAVLAVVGAAQLCLSGERPSDGRDDLRPRDDGRLEYRRYRIEEELKGLPGHDWAGLYSAGDGLTGTRLAVAPRAGYVWTEFGDSGPWEARSAGSVGQQGDLLLLRHAAEAHLRDGVRIVRWGERRYLIPLRGLMGFAAAINLGTEPGRTFHGGFLLRNGGESIQVTGLPELPAEVVALIRKQPLEARIQAVGVTQESAVGSKTTVLLDVGSCQGAVPDLELSAKAPQAGDAVIVRTLERSSVASFYGLPGWKRPEKGWRLSTHR